MPSEQRLHPSTLLFDLAKHVKQFARAGGAGALRHVAVDRRTRRDVRPHAVRWELWLLVLFVPAAVVSIVRYLTFRLRYDDHELVIRSGLIFRNERHVPFSRIQNVDAIQNVFHRLLGVVEVRVETGGGKEEEAKLSVLPHAAFHRNAASMCSRRRGAVSSTAHCRSTSTRAPVTGARVHDARAS